MLHILKSAGLPTIILVPQREQILQWHWIIWLVGGTRRGLECMSSITNWSYWRKNIANYHSIIMKSFQGVQIYSSETYQSVWNINSYCLHKFLLYKYCYSIARYNHKPSHSFSQSLCVLYVIHLIHNFSTWKGQQYKYPITKPHSGHKSSWFI